MATMGAKSEVDGGNAFSTSTFDSLEESPCESGVRGGVGDETSAQRRLSTSGLELCIRWGTATCGMFGRTENRGKRQTDIP